VQDAYIDCPHCHRRIELTGALAGPLVERIRTELAERVRAEVRQGAEGELAALRADLKVKSERLDEARKNELALLRTKAELEERERGLELEVARRSDAQREAIRTQAKAEQADEYRLKDAEKDKQIADMRKTIDELKRKSEQGSMQTQGEVLELELEAALRQRFPTDRIEPVAKGAHGADVAQRVRLPNGHECGTILWESKRTKAWSDGWLPKLKDDQRAAKADVAVIVSTTLPKEVETFANVQGVWVTSVACAEPLGSALRAALVAVAEVRRASEGQQGKMEQVYRYLVGPDFRRRIEGIVEAFTTLRADLEREKAAFHRMWSAREAQLARVLTQTAGLRGDLEGIAGGDAPPIAGLELPA
jgi:hypothetical protein